VLLFLRGSAWLRPETPDLTIRLVLQDRVLTATTRANVGGIVKTCGSACHAAGASPPDLLCRSMRLPSSHSAPARSRRLVRTQVPGTPRLGTDGRREPGAVDGEPPGGVDTRGLAPRLGCNTAMSVMPRPWVRRG
jgi:hypothetical protein